MQIQPFVFNWPGTEHSARHIYDQIDNCVMINSGMESVVDRCHNIGSESYFSAQFRKMLSLHDGESVILHIQGDVSYDNWSGLIRDAKQYISKYSAGVYYPVVKNTSWTADKMACTKKSTTDHNISYVATGDETVWFIHPRVIDYYTTHDLDKVMQQNKYGFGWDFIFCAICHHNNIPVIRDNNHVIDHSKSKGYDFHDAWVEFKHMLASLPDDLKLLADMINNNHKRHDLKNHVDKYCI